MSGKTEKQLRDKRLLKKLAVEVDSLRIIRRSFNISQMDLRITNRSLARWKNIAKVGIPILFLSGIALGIYVAHTVLKNASL